MSRSCRLVCCRTGADCARSTPRELGGSRFPRSGNHPGYEGMDGVLHRPDYFPGRGSAPCSRVPLPTLWAWGTVAQGNCKVAMAVAMFPNADLDVCLLHPSHIGRGARSESRIPLRTRLRTRPVLFRGDVGLTVEIAAAYNLGSRAVHGGSKHAGDDDR